jgi:hypothetical protein
MSDPRGATGVQPKTPRAHRERTPWWIWVLLLVCGVIIVGVVAVTRLSVIVDPPDDTLRIENRTDVTVYISYVLYDGTEVPSERIPVLERHSSVEIYISCGAGGYVARDEKGTLVSRRGPFEECNFEDWIIEPSGG